MNCVSSFCVAHSTLHPPRRHAPRFPPPMCKVFIAAESSRILAIFVSQRRRFPCLPPSRILTLAAVLLFPAVHIGGKILICVNFKDFCNLSL
jgi:hypothetical protein